MDIQDDDERDDNTVADAALLPLIHANPGASPNDLASLALANINMGDAPPVAIFAARRTLRNRAAELLGVEPPPACMNADEDRMSREIEAAVMRAIAELEREQAETP